MIPKTPLVDIAYGTERKKPTTKSTINLSHNNQLVSKPEKFKSVSNMAPPSSRINGEPHNTLFKALIETKKAVAQEENNSNPLVKDIIGPSLVALLQLNVFSKNPTKKTWKVVESAFHNLHHSIINCRKLKDHPFIVNLVRLKNVILNNYHWRCIPPVEIHREILELESVIQRFISHDKNNISKLEVESALIFEKNISNSIPKTNHAKILHDTKKEKSDTNKLVIDLNSSSNPKKDICSHKNQAFSKPGKVVLNQGKSSDPRPDRSPHDHAILNLLKRAKNLVLNIKLLIPDVPMQNFISNFAIAVEVYIFYCDSCSAYFYNSSTVVFEDLPCINIRQSVPLTCLHNLLQKITNLIIFSYPKYHIPPPSVIAELRRFLRALDKMEKSWKDSSLGSESVLDDTCATVITKINNMILKTFSGLVPSTSLQALVTMLINALDSYIPCFVSSTKHNWDHTKKMFRKVRDCNVNVDSRAEINLSELIDAISIVSQYKYIPNTQVQSKLSLLKVTLEELKAQWNSKTSSNASEPQEKSEKASVISPNSTEKTIGNKELLDLLRKVKHDIGNYVGIPDEIFQQELFGLIKHLQNCYTSWEKSAICVANNDAISKDKISEPFSMNFKTTDSKIATSIYLEQKQTKVTTPTNLKPTDPNVTANNLKSAQLQVLASNNLKVMESKISSPNNQSSIPSKLSVPTNLMSITNNFKSFISFDKKTDQPVNSHMMMTRSKSNVDKIDDIQMQVQETYVACEVSPSSDEIEGVERYAKKVVTSVPCLNSTINCYVFDEVFLTEKQLKNLKLEIENLSSTNAFDVSKSLSNILQQIKHGNMLPCSTVIDLNILIKCFEAKLFGNQTVLENLVNDCFNENVDEVLSSHEKYQQRCALYETYIDALPYVYEDEALERLLGFSDSAFDFLNASYLETDEGCSETFNGYNSMISESFIPRANGIPNEIDHDMSNYLDDDTEEENDNNGDTEENPNCFRNLSDNGGLVLDFFEQLGAHEDSSVFSVLIDQPDQDVIDITNRKLLKYKAFMLLPDSDVHFKKNRLVLEFPGTQAFLQFANENEDLVRRLKLISNRAPKTSQKKKEAIPETPQFMSTLLKDQCKTFIRSKKSIEEEVADKLKVFESCKESAVEKQLLNDLDNEIRSIFPPKHKLYVFGSRATGHATTDSDLDIYCDVTGHDYVRGISYEKQKACMFKLKQKLSKNSAKFSSIKCLYNARVPIVKLFHKPTGIHCDISFKDGTSVENTKLLKVYMDLDPRVNWLLTAMKMWAQYNEIIGPKFFTSHGLTWLILFFMMQVKLVPPVQELQSTCIRKVIRDWNVGFKKPSAWKPKVEMSAMDLFIGFFSWVVTTDLTSYCLCTVTGEMIPKYVFEDVSLMKKYGDGVFGEYAERLAVEHIRKVNQLSSYDSIEMNGSDGLCVQDPFEHCRNVVRYVTDQNYGVFLKLCRITDQFFE